MRSKLLVFIAASLLVATAGVAAHHVNGTWLLSVTLGDGQGGEASVALEEKEAGKLTGSYTGALGTAEVSGTVAGDAVTFWFDSQAGKITYQGKVAGDTMEGTCTYGQLGNGTFKGKKKLPAPFSSASAARAASVTRGCPPRQRVLEPRPARQVAGPYGHSANAPVS